jgi:hypothetical protein
VTEIYNALTKPELIMGLIVLLGGIFMALQKLGLVTISLRRDVARNVSMPGDPAGKCPDPGCSANVHQICLDVTALVKDNKDFKKEIFVRMDKVSQHLAFIRGRMGMKE